MNTTMFIVGLIIFILYMSGLLFIINKGHTEQKREMMNDPEIPKDFKKNIDQIIKNNFQKQLLN